MNYLIVDLEATCCDQGVVPRYEMEIIEIGAVMVAAPNYDVIDAFETFIRPVRYPQLTDFCKQLTTISQQDVDTAPGFADAIQAFKQWLHPYAPVNFCSWGDYDYKQFQQDCAFHDLLMPFSCKRRNLKKEFANHFALRKRPGMADALRHLGLPLEGTHHRGIDDARNIARIFRCMEMGSN